MGRYITATKVALTLCSRGRVAMNLSVPGSAPNIGRKRPYKINTPPKG